MAPTWPPRVTLSLAGEKKESRKKASLTPLRSPFFKESLNRGAEEECRKMHIPARARSHLSELQTSHRSMNSGKPGGLGGLLACHLFRMSKWHLRRQSGPGRMGTKVQKGGLLFSLHRSWVLLKGKCPGYPEFQHDVSIPESQRIPGSYRLLRPAWPMPSPYQHRSSTCKTSGPAVLRTPSGGPKLWATFSSLTALHPTCEGSR